METPYFNNNSTKLHIFSVTVFFTFKRVSHFTECTKYVDNLAEDRRYNKIAKLNIKNFPIWASAIKNGKYNIFMQFEFFSNQIILLCN